MDRYIDKYNSLIDKGYDEGELYKYFYVDEDVIMGIVDSIYNDYVSKVITVDNPRCLIVGGQPGSGKSYFCNKYVIDNNDYVYVSLDNYRVYHPYYEDIRKMVIDKWGDDNGDEKDNPSSDLTNITHYFAVRVNDILFDRLSNNNYNILLEWNLRYAEGPLETIERIKKLGYIIDIVVVVTSRYVSYEACKLRYNVMSGYNRLARRVSKYFHDMCVEGLISSIGKINEVGYIRNKTINSIVCMLRDGHIIWDSDMDSNVSLLLGDYLNSHIEGVNDISYIERIYNEENNL